MVVNVYSYEFAEYRFNKLWYRPKFLKYVRVQFNAVTANCYKENTPTCKAVEKQDNYLKIFMLRYLKVHASYRNSFMAYVNQMWQITNTDTKFLGAMQQKEMEDYVISKVGTKPFFSTTKLTVPDVLGLIRRVARNRCDVEMIKQNIEHLLRDELLDVNLLSRIDFTLEQTLFVWELQMKHIFAKMQRPVTIPKVTFKTTATNFSQVVKPVKMKAEELLCDEFLSDVESDEEMFKMDLAEEEKTPDAPRVFDASAGPPSPFLAQCPSCLKIVSLPWGRHNGNFTCGSCLTIFTATHSNIIV